MVNSLACLASLRLKLAEEALSSLAMAAKLELFMTSTMFRLASGLVGPDPGKAGAEDEIENELETLGDIAVEFPFSLAPTCCWRPVEIVSSKELNLVKFIIQPSILRNISWSLTFCQDTLSWLDEMASTITSSGWPGNVLMPSATPALERAAR